MLVIKDNRDITSVKVKMMATNCIDGDITFAHCLPHEYHKLNSLYELYKILIVTILYIAIATPFKVTCGYNKIIFG